AGVCVALPGRCRRIERLEVIEGMMWNWNRLSGQFGNLAVENAFGSLQAGPAPFVQPGPLTSPLAFDQPPAYHAQSTPAADSRSPIVGLLTGGSRRASAVPGENGWWDGWVRFTAEAPQTKPGT